MPVIADRRTNPVDGCAERHVVLGCGHGLDRGHGSGAEAVRLCETPARLHAAPAMKQLP